MKDLFGLILEFLFEGVFEKIIGFFVNLFKRLIRKIRVLVIGRENFILGLRKRMNQTFILFEDLGEIAKEGEVGFIEDVLDVNYFEVSFRNSDGSRRVVNGKDLFPVRFNLMDLD